MTNLRIYVTQALMFYGGGILFIIGLYQLAAEIYTAGFILATLGMIFVALSYVYARIGAKIISINCPNCEGLGYFEVEVDGETRKEICEVCGGTGRLYDKATLQYLQAKKLEKRNKVEEENLSSKSKLVEEKHENNTTGE